MEAQLTAVGSNGSMTMSLEDGIYVNKKSERNGDLMNMVLKETRDDDDGRKARQAASLNDARCDNNTIFIISHHRYSHLMCQRATTRRAHER